LVRDSLNENSYAPKAKIQAFGPDCAQSALAPGDPNCILRHPSDSQLHIGDDRVSKRVRFLNARLSCLLLRLQYFQSLEGLNQSESQLKMLVFVATVTGISNEFMTGVVCKTAWFFTNGNHSVRRQKARIGKIRESFDANCAGSTSS